VDFTAHPSLKAQLQLRAHTLGEDAATAESFEQELDVWRDVAALIESSPQPYQYYVELAAATGYRNTMMRLGLCRPRMTFEKPLSLIPGWMALNVRTVA
jgi:hypothetical protein